MFSAALREMLITVLGTWRFLQMCMVEYVVLPIMRTIPRHYVPKKYPKHRLEKDYTLSINYHTFLAAKRFFRLRYGTMIQTGDSAPNFDVVTLESASKKLFDFKRDGRMLVVSFGSNT